MSNEDINCNFTLEKVYKLLEDQNIYVDKMYEFIHSKKTDNKLIMISLGRIWFNLLMPPDYPLVNQPVPKDDISNKYMLDISNKYSPKIASETCQKLLHEAFKLSTINPKSFLIDGFVLPPYWIAKKDKFSKNAPKMTDEEFLKESQELTKELLVYFKDKGIGINDVIESKTKGGSEDWKALLVARGFVIDIEGNISRINEANNDGYSVDSYYKGGAQARRNYFVRSTMTSKPGYLARKVTMACANIKIVSDDCGSTQYLKINVDNKLAPRFFGRYYKNEKGDGLLCVTNSDDIKNKTMEFRSPIYCKEQNGLCNKCYGRLSNLVNNNNVGILAGGAVNNETINAMMKMRHKATQVEFVDVNFIKIFKDSNIDEKLINLFFDIKEKQIFAKKDCKIIINEKDYHDDAISDLGEKYDIPGILDVSLITGSIEENITFPFNFNLFLFKPENTEDKGSIHILSYINEEKIVEKDKYIKDMKPAIIDRLFEGGMKHITKPEILLNVLLSELTQSDSCHLELIVSNMFRTKDDLTIYGRIGGYKNCKLVGAKEAPFIDSWLTALAFENPNKAIKVGLLKNRESNLNPIENIVLDKFYNEEAE